MFWVLYRNPVQPEEVPTLRNDLPRELDRRLLLAAYPKQDAQQLRAGERFGPLGQQPLPRPELRGELLDGVPPTLHVRILYYTGALLMGRFATYVGGFETQWYRIHR